MHIIKKTPLAIFLSGLYISSLHAEMIFPTDMLMSEGNELADLSQFQADGTQLPGAYSVDIYLNRKFVTSSTIRFNSVPTTDKNGGEKDDTGLYPCLSRKNLEMVGIRTAEFPELMAKDINDCVRPSAYVTGLTTAFDFQKMRLDISAPQKYSRTQARGYVDPELWDDGINAALMNYRFSGNNRVALGSRSDSYYLNLDSGVNLGPWRLRDSRNWNYNNTRYGHTQEWQHAKTYLERPIIPLRSSLVMGESTTGSDVFDSLGFRGVQISTDDNMYPDTMRGFAPVVRGAAESNAEVSVRQNGYTIYKTTVSPGAFEINDLSPVYSSGDLEVTVKEAGGNTRVFTVPYSAVPALQREGHLKYSLTAGRYRAASSRYDAPLFSQGMLLWGLPHNVTLYGGIQYSQDYLAIQSGAGINMGRMGALSADVTHANSTIADGSEHSGQSMRLLYAHAFQPTGTSLRLTGYRYNTKGFHTLEETALKSMKGHLNDHDRLDENGDPVTNTWSDYYNLYNNKRSRIEANISQKLGGFGSIWLSGSQQTYWSSQGRNESLQAGYGNSIGPVNYFLNLGYSRQINDGAPSYTDKTISLSLSVPLDKLLTSGSIYASFNASRDSNGNFTQQAGLSGTLLEDRNLNWNISQGYTRGQSTTGNASVNYRGGYGNANAGYSYSNDWRRYSYGVSGGMILHENGLTLGQPLGETSILIATPGVPGVSIRNAPGVKTDWRGYTIKPHASAYRENRVAVDVEALDDRAEVDEGISRVIPTKGAVVRTKFNARQGFRILMTLTHDGKPLPFGTVVSADSSGGIVGDDGQVYLSGMPEQGNINASWGSTADQQCSLNYTMTDRETSASLAKMTGECR